MTDLPEGRSSAAAPAAPAARRRRRILVGTAGLVAVGLLGSGCAAGRIAQTAYETPVIDGIHASVGQISVNGASVLAPQVYWAKGGEAPLQVILVNAGDQDDQLTGVTSSVASGVALLPSSASFLTESPTDSVAVSNPMSGSAASSASASISGAQGTPPVAGQSSGVPQGSSPGTTAPVSGSTSGIPTPGAGQTGASGSSGQSGSSSGSSGSGASSGSGGSTSVDVPVDAHQSVSLGFLPNNQALVLRGLNQDLYPSTPVTVTFTFAHAGSLTITITVRLQSSPPSASYVPSLDPPYKGSGAPDTGS